MAGSATRYKKHQMWIRQQVLNRSDHINRELTDLHQLISTASMALKTVTILPTVLDCTPHTSQTVHIHAVQYH